MGDETFDANDFEQKLTKLKDTQEGIQGLSAWCLQKRSHHKKIVATWLNVLKNGKILRFVDCHPVYIEFSFSSSRASADSFLLSKRCDPTQQAEELRIC